MVDYDPCRYGTMSWRRDLPHLSGAFHPTPSTFYVTELPAYSCSGQGEHLFIEVRKAAMDHFQVLERLKSLLALSESEIGYSGIKDKQATTSQWFSLPWRCHSRLDSLADQGLEVLTVQRHDNKLRLGHLKGNRFRALIEGASQDDEILGQKLKGLASGFANFYGEQRFGRKRDTHLIGLSLLTGRGQAVPGRFRTRRSRQLALSAWQSHAFNSYLAARWQAHQGIEVEFGDLLMTQRGGVFLCEDPAVDQERFERGEVVPAGPMFGSKIKAASGRPGALAQEVFQSYGIGFEQIELMGKRLPGSHRALLARPSNLSWHRQGQNLWVSFDLEAGSYASVLLGELVGSVQAPFAAEREVLASIGNENQ